MVGQSNLLLQYGIDKRLWTSLSILCLRSFSEFVGIKEKIMDGYEFKKHVDRAAELAPHDHTIQHLLGRYEAERWW